MVVPRGQRVAHVMRSLLLSPTPACSRFPMRLDFNAGPTTSFPLHTPTLRLS